MMSLSLTDCNQNKFYFRFYKSFRKFVLWMPAFMFGFFQKKSFKIIVDTDRSKKEMQLFYNCSSDKIEVIPFNTFLPGYYESKKETFKSEDLNKKFDFLNKNKTFFYPAQFWAHKNHMYI